MREQADTGLNLEHALFIPQAEQEHAARPGVTGQGLRVPILKKRMRPEGL
jgi:hypothetical protein